MAFVRVVGLAMLGWIAFQGAASAGPGCDRCTAILEALASGDPATFEAAARENYTPDLYARRTAEERREFLTAVHASFGAFVIVAVEREGQSVRYTAHGESGAPVTIIFKFDPSDGHIASLAIEVGDTGGEGPPLPPPAPVAVDQSGADMAAAIDGWIAPFVEAEDFAGTILIAKDGVPLLTRTYGLADRDAGKPNAGDTRFNVASIGKIFTQTAIARLIQDGKLSLDDTIGELLPDYPNADAKAATIERLVAHRAGIGDFFGPEFEAADKARFASNHDFYLLVSSQPQRFAPGTREEYCNGCYIVLGEIIERVSGMSFEQYVAETVFAPAGMSSTSYAPVDGAATAIPYTRSAGPGSPLIDARAQHGAAGSGAGGLVSSAADLLAFDNALRTGVLLDAARSGWVLRSLAVEKGRHMAPLSIAGGAPGISVVLSSDGVWTIIVLGNVDEPTPERIGLALARELHR